MAQPEPTVQAAILARLDEFLASQRVALRPLLSQAGLSPDALAMPDARLSLNAVANLIDLAARKTGDPCFGLHFGAYLPPGSSGVLGHLVMSAPTVEDALRSVERYLALFVSPVAISYAEIRGGAVIRWKYPDTFTAPRLQYSGLTISALLTRLQDAAGADVRPRSAELDHRAFDCPAEVRRLLGRSVRYNRPENVLTFDANILRKRIAGVPTGVFGLMQQLGDRMLEEQRQQLDIVEMTRRQIATHLGNGRSNLHNVAGIFGLSARALQGRLKKAGATFEAVRTGTRRELAVNYLRNTDLPMTEIAYLLGFSELSAFTRAMQRWFKMSPKKYRAMARRQTDTRR